MAETNLKSLKIKARKEIESAKNHEEIKAIFNKYLSKKGELTLVLRSLAKLPEKQRKIQGKLANEIKQEINKAIALKTHTLNPAPSILEKDWFDITVPGKKPVPGHLNPLTETKREVERIFSSMGFSVVRGPDIENEWYNFDALNIPKNHPARDQWDTFWLKDPENQKLLLRTHTSPVQIRYMESHKPPLRIIAPGNVFRHEATDASHEFQLFQIEGLMIDRDISAANFKYVIEQFFRNFFNKDVKSRLRPDFFPFTEPSFDVSISCLVCEGKGCPVCKGGGWVEVAGAGMVHPNVFKNAKLNPKEWPASNASRSDAGWQGWAFGFGLERLAMLKYKINDIRLFRSGDLRFLNQF